MRIVLRDPVCESAITRDNANWTYKYGGNTYVFCSLDCMLAFDEAREKYSENGQRSAIP